jgi:hypothetical protein
MVASAHQRVTTARCVPSKRIRTSPCCGCKETPLSPHLPPRRLYCTSIATVPRHSAAAPRKRIWTHPPPHAAGATKPFATFCHRWERLLMPILQLRRPYRRRKVPCRITNPGRLFLNLNNRLPSLSSYLSCWVVLAPAASDENRMWFRTGYEDLATRGWPHMVAWMSLMQTIMSAMT